MRPTFSATEDVLTGEQTSDAKTTRTVETAAAALIGLGLLLRLLIAGQPPERLIPVCLADDAFYYLRIAGHVLAGDGATFDGRIPTNGYHPLWMLVSLGAVKLGGVTDGARVLTLLLALIGAGNALLIWRLAARWFGPWAGAWAAGFWSLNPLVFFTELMGVEAPLMMLLALATLYVYLPLREGRAGARRWGLVGLLLGLTLLARTDAVLLAVPLGIDIAFVRGKRRFIETGIVAGVAFIVVAPWLIYNLVSFGTIVQDSAHSLMLRERMWFAASSETLSHKLAGQARSGFADYLVRLAGLPNAALVGLVTGLLAGALAGARLVFRRAVWDSRARESWPVFTWATLVWVFYILYFWQQKYWYFLPVLLALTLAGALAAGYVARAISPRAAGWSLALLGAVMAAGFLSFGLRLWMNGYHPWQKTYLEAAAYARELAREDPDTKVAAMNAGILSAYSGLDVVNLDGVVNPDAWEALRDHDLLGYLRREQITVLIDHVKLIGSYGAFAGDEWPRSFSLLRRFETPPFAGDVVALHLLAPGEQP